MMEEKLPGIMGMAGGAQQPPMAQPSGGGDELAMMLAQVMAAPGGMEQLQAALQQAQQMLAGAGQPR